MAHRLMNDHVAHSPSVTDQQAQSETANLPENVGWGIVSGPPLRHWSQ